MFYTGIEPGAAVGAPLDIDAGPRAIQRLDLLAQPADDLIDIGLGASQL
jgi:hypothetical protein